MNPAASLRPSSPMLAPRPLASGNGRHTTIPIATDPDAAALHAGCGACHQAAEGPLCQVRMDEAPGAPQLVGPPDELQVLLRALAGCLGFDAAAPDARLIRSLTVLPDEVSLVLGVGRHCGGALLADAAFQTLRRLRPDTDIYVTHAA